MKLNNNNNQITFINLFFLFATLICFALDKCAAHGFVKPTSLETKPSTSNNIASPPETTNNGKQSSFPPSEAPSAEIAPSPSSFPPSEAPSEMAPSPSPGDDSSEPSSSFSGAFSDILTGDLNDQSIKKPHDKNGVGEEICSHTHYPDICLITIQPLLNQPAKIDIKLVLAASIKATVHQVKLTVHKVEMHAATSPELANELGDCLEKYRNTLKSLKTAMGDIPSNDYGKLTITLSTVMADVSTCESKFEDLKSKSKSSITKTHGLVSMMVNNCLSISSLIH